MIKFLAFILVFLIMLSPAIVYFLVKILTHNVEYATISALIFLGIMGYTGLALLYKCFKVDNERGGFLR